MVYVDFKRLKKILPDGFSLATLALKWILSHDAVSVVIPGAADKFQVEMNTSTSDLRDISDIIPQINSIYDSYLWSDGSIFSEILVDTSGNYSVIAQTKVKRFVGKGIRNIEHRIIASERGNLFFDGDRNFGYGGLKYDGRWSGVAKKIIKKFDLKDNSKILQIASEKGFLIHEIKKINPKINVFRI